jgi:hypothetical protein
MSLVFSHAIAADTSLPFLVRRHELQKILREMFKTTPTLFVRSTVLLGEQAVIRFPANRADGFINVIFH